MVRGILESLLREYEAGILEPLLRESLPSSSRSCEDLSMHLVLLTVLALGKLSASAATAKLPPTWKICQLTPQYDKCVSREVEHALMDLANGYAPLGIKSIDPLEITKLEIQQGSGPININLKWKDVLIYGFKNGKISNLKANLDELTIFSEIAFPRIELNGTYTIDGKVLVLPIKGEGPSKVLLDNVKGNFGLTGKRVMRKGVEYMQVTSFTFNFEPSGFKIQLDNLFNGDKLLGNNMNRFLNENWRDILKEMKPAIQEAFGLSFGAITNRIFNKIPLADIFPK